MAINMVGEASLPAQKSAVWNLLNDPEVLKACIPGCESLEMLSETRFAAIAKVKVGPVRATFRGKVNLEDLDPPNGYRLVGEGDGGVAGFAKGGAKVQLLEVDGGTLLRYEVEAHIGGKLAQIGARLIDGVAKKTADEFFANFSEAVKNRG
jgi:uncharacterized protein